ncbi:helix-turn-helix domain-containing protein [Traorella massiliensis]|uniref:helix-turn-helix domain-containing protein n=1 Tax=Traorella massiliensis TaxID=1903263 RepID=UPI0023565BD1|nr:helix-turn-helix transcriptional regulator [Traorella massiliensis]
MINNIIDYKLIGKRIKQKRNEKRITQEQLASDLSLSTFYISKIENGKSTPTLETLAEIAKYLELDLAYLITGTSKLENEYYLKQISEILSKATNKQLDLIIRLSKAVLEE